ncbi:MAG: hypothetical protein JWM51_1064 [Microbacteriaceae bacterium]|nr:hypothetical protein [Microbacteriaceae bacterium]
MPTTMRDVSNEAVLLAGGARAILLQIAMPQVGHGVARHSDFTADPLRRLRNTLTYLYVLVYGTPAEVDRITGYVDRAHAPVRSAAGEPGPAYDAVDPEQQLWVAATLYDSAMVMHDAVFGALPTDDAESLYAEYRRIGTALQMPAELWPENRAAFRDYWQQALEALAVDDESRRVARDLLFPAGGPWWIRALMPVMRFLTAGMLPESLRAQFGLPWNERRARGYRRVIRLTAVVYPRLPGALRHWPARHYLLAFRKGAPQ